MHYCGSRLMKHTYISLARGNVSQKPFNRLLLTTFSKSSQVPSSYLFLPSLSRDPSKNQQHFPLVIVLDFYCTSIRFPCPQLSQEMCGSVIWGGGALSGREGTRKCISLSLRWDERTLMLYPVFSYTSGRTGLHKRCFKSVSFFGSE